MFKLLRHALSGHSHRVELFLSLIGQPFERVDVDLAAGAHKAPDFLALNPFGQVPVLTSDEAVLSDSTAILVYLSERYAPEWRGRDPFERAEIQRWLSVASNEIANGPAAARLVTVFGAPLDHEAAKAKAHRVLEVLQGRLRDRIWLAAADRPTIADVAVYTYVAHAPEGGVSLEAYPAVRAWLARVEALPGFVPMAATRAGLRA